MKPSQKASNVAFAAIALASLGALTTEAAWGQGFKVPNPKEIQSRPNIQSKPVTLTINNPNRFKVQIKTGQSWENAGNATRITKRYFLPNLVGASKKVEVRIGEGQGKFHHTPPNSFFGEMYGAETYSVKLGFKGIERRSLSVDCTGGRCRRAAQVWQAVNANTATLNLTSPPLTINAKLGIGQLSFPPYPAILQLCSPGSSSYLPWLGGSINGQRTNGTVNNIQLTNFNTSSPLAALRSWCSRNASGRSGFITKALKYSDAAVAAYGPNQTITQATAGRLQGKTIWNPSGSFKVLVKSGGRFQTTERNSNQHDLDLLKSLFASNNKTLYVIKSLTPSGRTLSHNVADFSGVINQLNSTNGTIRGCGDTRKPRSWCGRIGRNTTFQIPVNKGKISVPLWPDPPIYAVSLRRPMNISIRNASISMPSQGVMKLRLQVKTSAVSGEVWATGKVNDWDPDYSISAGTFTFEVPLSIAKSGNTVIVRQTQNCNSGEYCMTDVSGFRLSIDNYPFVGGAEREFTKDLRDRFKINVGTQLQAALRGINGKTFNLAPNVPGVSNPMNALLGVSSSITPDLRISSNKLKLLYRPQVTFVTPRLLDTLAPTYTVPDLDL